jgi:hypothetical protein
MMNRPQAKLRPVFYLWPYKIMPFSTCSSEPFATVMHCIRKRKLNSRSKKTGFRILDFMGYRTAIEMLLTGLAGVNAQ